MFPSRNVTYTTYYTVIIGGETYTDHVNSATAAQAIRIALALVSAAGRGSFVEVFSDHSDQVMFARER